MASGARRADENVSAALMPAPPTEEHHKPAGGSRHNVSRKGELADTRHIGLRRGSTMPNYWGTGVEAPRSPENHAAASPLNSPPLQNTFSLAPRPRSSSQPVPPQSKTVAFDLGSRASSPSGESELTSRHAADRGYETDDSDSTLDDSSRDRSRYRRYPISDRHRPSSTYSPDPTSSASKRHRSSREPARDERHSDSESTIELPERFDSHGRRKHEDPLENFLGRFINGVESSSRKRRSKIH